MNFTLGLSSSIQVKGWGFNSLTNWLAIGDVAVIRGDGTVEVVEVNGNTADSVRITRQEQEMQEVTSLLKNGKGKLEGQDITICSISR